MDDLRKVLIVLHDLLWLIISLANKSYNLSCFHDNGSFCEGGLWVRIGQTIIFECLIGHVTQCDSCSDDNTVGATHLS